MYVYVCVCVCVYATVFPVSRVNPTYSVPGLGLTRETLGLTRHLCVYRYTQNRELGFTIYVSGSPERLSIERSVSQCVSIHRCMYVHIYTYIGRSVSLYVFIHRCMVYTHLYLHWTIFLSMCIYTQMYVMSIYIPGRLGPRGTGVLRWPPY